jgi:hypothetical protein
MISIMWLTSYDPGGAWPVAEVILGERVQLGQRTDLAWASVTPPIALGDRTRTRILLASRHLGDSVWQTPERWPMHVYVCYVLDESDESSTTLSREQVRIASWGLLHQSRERADSDPF